MLYPDRQLPFTQQGMKCIDVEFGIGYLNAEQCSSFHDATAGIDLAAWCGCEDAVVGFPPSSCSLCGDDDDAEDLQQVVRDDVQVPDAPIGVTCQSLAEWAPYIQQDSFCEARITLLRGECCALAPPSPPLSTQVPSAMPTAAAESNSEPPHQVSGTAGGIAELAAYRASMKRILFSLVGYVVLTVVG